MNTKEQLINSLIQKNGYKSFLEIGTQKGECFEQIKCDLKVGIDPTPINYFDNVHIMTSDKFFSINGDKYDIIFIDGLHHAEQVLKDFNNSLDILNEGGTILLHDMMPTSELTQRVPRESKEWYGDCWRVGYYLLLNTSHDLKFHKFDCGILEMQVDNTPTLWGNIRELEDITYDKDFERYLELI